MDKLIFQTAPVVTLATNIFINCKILLKYEDINLIELIKEEGLGYTTQIPIYHSDGTYLAKVKGNRVFSTEDGKKVGINMEQFKDVTVCKMGAQTLFEFHHGTGDSFKAYAELYAPEGYFVKIVDSPQPQLLDTNGNALEIGGVIMSGNTFRNLSTCIALKKNGSLSIG